MTSTNDGKDVKSNITSGPKGKSYYIELYKSLEARLCEGGSASERTQHLCEAWRRVHSLCQHSAPSTHTHLLSWLQRHTSRAVLQTDWQKPERKDDRKCLEEAIDYFISESDAAAAARSAGSTLWELQLVARGEWFKRVLEHPWDHPVLTLLLNPNGTPPTDEEVLEWLKEERGVTFVMRLHTLVGEKCDDIAVSLASAVMERVRAGMPPVCDAVDSKDKPPENAEPTFGDRLKEEAGFTQDVLETITDIEFVLLHKRDSKRCITLAKQTPLLGAYHLIERLQKRLEISPREKRLWKNSKEVAVLIAQVVIARCMMVSVCAGVARTALYCCARLLARLLAGRLPSAAAALATQAPTAAHLHTLAHAVDKQLSASNEMKPYVCELYVRAITAGMNELERLKLKTEKESDARLMEKTLALWFVQLGTVLAHNDRLRCECTLTAFSLHPSQKMYERLDVAPQLAPVVADSDESKDDIVKSEFGSWANDSRSQTNFVKTSETLNLKQTQNQANVLSTAIFNEGEALGLSPELCQDIAVLLSGPRIKTLSWDMDRKLLLENCRTYMERTGSGTRGLTHELKYLNIDLNQYQHLPEERDEDENDPYYGIEKGYEHLATPEEPEEIWEYANILERTDSASSYIEDDFIVPRRKKKNKKVPVTSDEDSDPLSFMAEAKKVQKKKERPHSKERSKERAKKKQDDATHEDDPLHIETSTPNDKQKPKEKKERKKKEKVPKAQPQKSLSDLVGVKVEKSKKQTKTITTTRVITPMTDSDYDSQGKCSLASLNSEGNELHDGLLSMDELQSSALKSSSLTASHSEILKKKQYNVAGGTTPKGSPSSSFEHLPSNFNRTAYMPPTPSSVHRHTMPSHARTSSPNLGRCKNDVRASITKLMEFRRQQSARTNLQSNIAQSPQRKPAIMRPDIPIQANVSPKAVAIPEIPKSYIKKEQAEKLAEIKREVDNLIAERKKMIQKNSVIQYASKDINKARSDSSQSHSGAQQPNVLPVKMTDIPYDRLMAEISERQGRVESAKSSHTQYEPGQPNISLHRSLNVVTAGQRDYQNFLKEYDHIKYGKCTSGHPLDMSKNSKKDIRPVNKLEPGLPQCTVTKVSSKALQSAKLPNPQKKPEVSLHTFSRLSYMLKNKHNEMKNKNLQEKPVYSHSTYQEVSSELDEIIKEHKRAQMQVIQAKKERLLAKTQSASAHEPMKNEKSAVKSRDHSISNLLQTPSTSTANTATTGRNSAPLKSCQIQQKVVSPPKASLSEKDHHDLLQLLRQQNKLNATHNQYSNVNLKPSTSNSTSAVSSTSPMNDLKSMHFQKQEQHSKPASQANHQRLAESKVINIISNSLIKPANENIDKYDNFVNTKCNTERIMASDSQDKLKKPAANKVLTKNIPVKLNPEIEKSEWQSVMSDILKHKTPLRGPNALDVALNKSSFEKAFENSLQPSAIYAQRHLKSKVGVEADKLYEKPYFPSSSTSPQNVVITTNKPVKAQRDIPKQQKATCNVKKKSEISINEKLIKQYPVIAKKIPQEVQRKQFTYAGPKHDDPFISGIPNTDYDLLEELMDDDLRKEIGELSSDDESYNAAAQSFFKPTKANEKRVSVEFNKPLNDTAIKSAGNVQCLNTRQSDSTMLSGIQNPVKCLNNMTPRAQRIDSLKLNQKAATNKTQGINLITSTVQSVPSYAPSTHNHAYNNAQALTNSQVMIDPNIYISAVPQQAPLQNVLLIGSELVYGGYSTVQTPVHTSSTYVAVNNEPNMTMYKTAQFGTTLVNPLIIESSIVVPTVNNFTCPIPVQSSGVNNSAQPTYPAINAELQKPRLDPRIIEKELCDIKGETSKPAHAADNPLPNNKLIDVNKTVERKVLSEVQELAVTEKTDKSRSLNIEMKKDALANQERLRNKRLAIINRQIYHRCRDETIPLSYSPLPVKTRMVSKLHDFPKAIPLAYASINLNENKDKLSDSADDTLLLTQIKNNLQDLSNAINEVKSPATPDSIESKENKSHATAPCRRILLRSSNKISIKATAVSSAPESSSNKKSKVKLKSPAVEAVSNVGDSSVQNNSGNQPVQAPKRASKRLRNKTFTINKDEKSPLQSQHQKPTLKVPAKNKSNKSDANIEMPTLKVILNELTIFDFEAELLGSKISKTVSENKEGQQNNSNVSKDDEIDKGILPDTKAIDNKPSVVTTHERTQNIIEHVTNKNIHNNVVNINDLSEKLNYVITSDINKETRSVLEKETSNNSNITDDVLDKSADDLLDKPSSDTKSVPKNEADEKVNRDIDKAFDKPANEKNKSVPEKEADGKKYEVANEAFDKPTRNKFEGPAVKEAGKNVNEVIDQVFDNSISDKTESTVAKEVEVIKIHDEIVDMPIRENPKNAPKEDKNISYEWFDKPASQIIRNASDKEADKNFTVKELQKPKIDDKDLTTPNTEEPKPSSGTYDNNLVPLVSVTGPEIISIDNTVEESTAKCTTFEETKYRSVAVNNPNKDDFKENIDLDMTVTCEETITSKKTPDFAIIRSARNKSINTQTQNEGTVSNSVKENDTQALNSGHIQSITVHGTGKKSVEPVPALPKILNEYESIASQHHNTREMHVVPSAIVKPTNNANDFDDDVVVIGNDSNRTSKTPVVEYANNSIENKMKTEVTTGCTNISEMSNMSQSFLVNVIIENLPSDEPFKKKIRVKLPNGKKFIITVPREMHVTMDTLFNCPSIKETLLNGLNCKKITLKMQHIVTVKKDDRATILGAEPVETIDLLSDDEDIIASKVNDNTTQIFETELGKYKIATIDSDLFKKHQTKLNRKSLILLKKVDETSDNRCGIPNSVNIIKNSILEVIPDKYVKGIINDIENELTSNTKKSSTDEIVEIDDSSNDSLDNVASFVDIEINKPEEKINELKNELLKELGVEAIQQPTRNTTKANTKLNSTDVVLEIDLTDDNHQPSEVCDLSIDPNKEKNPLHNLSKEEQLKITSRICHVKLVRCDGSSKIHDKRDRIAIEEICTKVSDDPQFTITEKYSILNDLDKNTVETEIRSSSPVLEISDVIISLDINSIRDREENLGGESAAQQVTSLSCEANWFTTKSTIHVESLNDVLPICPVIYKYYNTDADCETDTTNVVKERETFSSDYLSYTSPIHIEPAVNQVVPLTCESNWFTTKPTLHSSNENIAAMMRHSVYIQHDDDNDGKHATTSEAIEISTDVSASRDHVPPIHNESAVNRAIPLTCESNWFTTKSTLHSIDGTIAETLRHKVFKQHDVTYSKNAIISNVSETSLDAELHTSPDHVLPIHSDPVAHPVTQLSCDANWFTTKSTLRSRDWNNMIKCDILGQNNETYSENTTSDILTQVLPEAFDSSDNVSVINSEAAEHQVNSLSCEFNWITSQAPLHLKIANSAILSGSNNSENLDEDTYNESTTIKVFCEMSSETELPTIPDDTSRIRVSVTLPVTPLSCEANWFTTKSSLHSRNWNNALLSRAENNYHSEYTCNESATINVCSEMLTETEPPSILDDTTRIRVSVSHPVTPLPCEANWFTTKSSLHSRDWNIALLPRAENTYRNEDTCNESATTNVCSEMLTETEPPTILDDTSRIPVSVTHPVTPLSCEANWFTPKSSLHSINWNNALLSRTENTFENLDKDICNESATINAFSETSSETEPPAIPDDTSLIRVSFTQPVIPLSCEANWFTPKSSLHSSNRNNALLSRTENTFENLDKDICNESATINAFSEMSSETEPPDIPDDTSLIRVSFTHPVIPLSCEANWFTTKSSLRSKNRNNALLVRADIYEQHVESSCFESVNTNVVYEPSTERISSASLDDLSLVHVETVVHKLIPLSCEANWFTSKSTLHLHGLNNAASILPKVFYQRDKESVCESSKFTIITKKSNAKEEVSPRTNCVSSLVSLALKCFQDVNIIDQFVLIRDAKNHLPVNSLKRKSSSPDTFTTCKVSRLDDDLVYSEVNDCGINLTLESDTDTNSSFSLLEDITTSDLEESPVHESTDTVIIFDEAGNKNIDEDTGPEDNTIIIYNDDHNLNVANTDGDQVLRAACGQIYNDIKFNAKDRICDNEKDYFETETVHSIIKETDVKNISSINDNCSDYQSPETTDTLKEIDIESDLSRSPSPIIEISHILANDKQYNNYVALRRNSIDARSISREKDNIYDSLTPSPTKQIEIMHEINETNVPIHGKCLELPNLQNEQDHTADIHSSTSQSKDMTNTSIENDTIFTQNISTQARKGNEHTDDLDDIEVRLAEIVGQSLTADNTGKQCNQTYNLVRDTEKLNVSESLTIEKRNIELEDDGENIKIAINEEKQCFIHIEESPPKQFFTFIDHEYSTLLPENDNINLEDNHVYVSTHNGIFLSPDEVTEEIEEEIVFMHSDDIIDDISDNYSHTEIDNDVKDSTPKACTAWTTLNENLVNVDHNASSPVRNVDNTGDIEVTVLEIINKNPETTDFLVEKYDMSTKKVKNKEKAVLSSDDLSTETILSKYLTLFGNNSEVVEGIVEYEDPEAGTCYVIPIIEKTSKTVSTSDEDTEIVNRSVNKTQTDDEIVTPLTKDKLHDCPINYDDIESRLAQIVGEPLINVDTGAQTEQCNSCEISENLNKNDMLVHLDEKYKTFYSVEVESISESELNNPETYGKDILCPQIISNDNLKQNSSKSNDLEERKNDQKSTKRRSKCFEKSTNDMNSEVYTENLKVLRPKYTYSRSNEPIRHRRKSLKRKLDMSDIKTSAKKYRKGKNIDYPKRAGVASENTYSKEYKCLLDYCSSIKFSNAIYAIPFHKEDIDVHNALKAWPIKNSYSVTAEDSIEDNTTLFNQIEQVEPVTDPMKQTLTEEIMSEYNENSYTPSNIDETNFNMGFGEGSGRVIQELKDGEHTTFSAATLSDVKQLQPLLPSDVKETLVKPDFNISYEHEQRLNMKRFIDHLHFKEKVQSFFEKTKAELYTEWKLTNSKKIDENSHAAINWPFDLASPKSFTPSPVEVTVNVVQVGQPPVSTAAQNPVTCDPRVTHVSNVSPSQCSPENSSSDLQTNIKTEYTELTTAEITLPLMQEYAQRHHRIPAESQESINLYGTGDNASMCTEIKSIVKIEIMEETSQDNINENSAYENNDLGELTNGDINNGSQYRFHNINSNMTPEGDPNVQAVANSSKKSRPNISLSKDKQHSEISDKSDQVSNVMNAEGIIATQGMLKRNSDPLINTSSHNAQVDIVTTSQANANNNYTKSTPINALALQQALAQILPPPLNPTNTSESNQQAPATPPVLHIVQANNTQSVINKPNGTPVLHIVQNKSAMTNGTPTPQANAFGGLPLIDGAIQQNGNQLLHIVNTGNQKNSNAGQLLKRVNLLTNLANVQGSNEQKMVQFVCKSADGKSIQLPHQRSMVLRLQPLDPSSVPTTTKQNEAQDLSQSSSGSQSTRVNDKEPNSQEMKSRSLYEENYAKFVQNGESKSGQEKATSLPKFNQVFGKQIYQDKQNEMDSENLPENAECAQDENNAQLEQMSDISNPPPLIRKPHNQAQPSQAQSTLVQQIKQSIGPMNIQTMHGGVIYTRQIPVNIGNGQTINLITVPSTELVDDTVQKQQTDSKFGNQEGEPPIIKIVPTSQCSVTQNGSTDDDNNAVRSTNEVNAQPKPQPHPQPVLTQMRIKLPMLSKAPQMVGGTRVVRPSFFQIQRNVIGGANQQVYQQLVLTAAPSLGQSIRVPAQTPKPKSSETQSPESQMSSSTLEQLREFDMVLEQVKERSTVQPGTSTSKTNSFSKLEPSADTNNSTTSSTSSQESSTRVLYSVGNTQPLNMVNFVNRKSTITSTSTSSFVRSPDSTGIVESPSSSTHSHLPHTATSVSCASSCASEAAAATTVTHKPKKKKPKPSTSNSNPFNIKNTPKPSSQKPLEDEQTTQRILYILAEYKEQVENSPDKDKPAPRRRNNPAAPNAGSSKRKKSSSGSRRRDMSPVVGEDSCRTMGSEDSSCGTSLGECNDCLDTHSPEESPRKVVRRLTFEQETHITTQTRTIPQRNVIVADGQAFAVRGATGKPATTVLMPANYLLPVSMVKGGQQIAIVTNRGPKLLVGAGEGGAGGTLLLQRLIGPGGLKPVLARPGVRHIRLPTAALHNLQAFNIATPATVQPPDSTASPASAPTPPDLVDTRAMSSPWPDREAGESKPDGGNSSPDGSEPWNLPSSSIADDYGYEEIVRTDNMDRTVLDAIPDRYSPDMEAQRIFDKMFDVDSKKSMYDSRCGYDIDASDDDKAYHQVVQRKDGRHTRLTHVSAAALRHKYAILEHELRLQKSLSEECEDLGVDSPSASDLFPEAELLFAPSPAHEQTIDQCHTPQPSFLHGIPQPDLDDQIATDHLLTHSDRHDDLDINLDDVGEIVTVGEDGMTTIPLDHDEFARSHEEFARSHPNTTFHSEPEDGEIPPFTIAQGIKGRQITFHSRGAPGTVVMAPQTTVISQATVEATSAQNTVKFTDIDNMINSMPSPQHPHNTNIPSILVKDNGEGLTKFDRLLNESKELHMPNTASAIVHSSGNGTQVIRRVSYETIVSGDAKAAETRGMPLDNDASSPERQNLFWENNAPRAEKRRFDFSSEKCCRSPYEEANSDSSGIGAHTRLDSVIKAARTVRRRSDTSEESHPPLRTYPAKRSHQHHNHSEERSATKRASDRCQDGKDESKRRASNRGVVKRGCQCCNGSTALQKPKKSRPKKSDYPTH